MLTYMTTMQVLCNETKELITIEGNRVVAPSIEAAQRLIDSKGITYLTLVGQVISEVDSDENHAPIWSSLKNLEAVVYN